MNVQLIKPSNNPEHQSPLDQDQEMYSTIINPEPIGINEGNLIVSGGKLYLGNLYFQ